MYPEPGQGEAQAGRTASELSDVNAISPVEVWGIGDGPLLWPVRIRILFVIDGRINDSSDPTKFGLGYVLETLRDQWFAWWVRFEVVVMKRDDGFRFTQDGFDINGFDQVWFFGDWPGLLANDDAVGDDVIGDPDFSHSRTRSCGSWRSGWIVVVVCSLLAIMRCLERRCAIGSRVFARCVAGRARSRFRPLTVSLVTRLSSTVPVTRMCGRVIAGRNGYSRCYVRSPVASGVRRVTASSALRKERGDRALSGSHA